MITIAEQVQAFATSRRTPYAEYVDWCESWGAVHIFPEDEFLAEFAAPAIIAQPDATGDELLEARFKVDHDGEQSEWFLFDNDDCYCVAGPFNTEDEALVARREHINKEATQ